MLVRADEYVHPDYVNHEAAAHRPPGPEGMRQTVSWLRDAFSELRFDVRDAIADGDRVALRVQMSGVHTGPLMGMPPTNKPFSVQHIHIFCVADGKIVEHWANRDDLGGMSQLGLLPRSPPTPHTPAHVSSSRLSWRMTSRRLNSPSIPTSKP
jgi:predicted ester cyclase